MPRQMELIAGVSVLAWNAVLHAVVFVWFWRQSTQRSLPELTVLRVAMKNDESTIAFELSCEADTLKW